MNDRRTPYKTYRQVMTTARDAQALNRWKIILIRGDSDFLLTQTWQELRGIWEAAQWKVERIEGAQLNAERFLQATAARSLFDDMTLTIIQDAQQTTDILAHLQSVKSIKEIQNPIVFIWRAKDVGSKISKELDRLGILSIPCDEPAAWEVKDFLLEKNRHFQLNLTTDAIDLILEVVGTDLFKLNNEMKRLSQSLGGQAGSKNATAIRPYLDFLREDHAFKLDQLLCAGAFNKAHLLLHDLLQRGESPLAVLAILAMHCRKALQIQTGLKEGSQTIEIARQVRLPPSVVQNYIAYVQKRTTATFQRCLSLCHEADLRLKSRGEGKELWLNQILFELMS